MSLASGLYTIHSQLNDRPVGRYVAEDLSLRPKAIHLLPKEVVEIPKFVIEKKENGYIIRALGSPTGILQDKVFAFLINETDAEEWTITPQPQHGQNIYTIESHDRRVGWVAPDGDEDGIINARPLIAMLTFPPRFLPNSLFTIMHLPQE